MVSEPQVRVFGSPQELFRASAEKFCAVGSEAIQSHGKFSVALSGGSTPRGLHQELVTDFSAKLPRIGASLEAGPLVLRIASAARAPNTRPSNSELLARRFAPCTPVHATSPAA